ncbi:ABC transporter substrate-binding protein [Massilia sp. NR 4-1]|uniref:substrate-binding periplasmic protein n=1 Tax=Massilia sp. NR 4-1 TaxID=1678028 RepID=UPI00067E5071|nr:transporter substrate-binding domain-containing protein [Massilia sp. NR 4-1]AKU21825.1 ABC transporter substrate-binding protein [Massilia sp. NR 4-1]
MHRRTLLNLALLAYLPALSAYGASKAMRVSTLLETDPATDIAEQVLREAYRRLGMSLDVVRLPAERALVSANDGMMDGELYRKIGIERDYPNLMIVPIPLLTYEIVIFTLGTSFVVNGWESLRPFTIGFIRGIKIVEQNTQGMHIEPVATMMQALQKMTMGRTDVVVGNRVSGLAMAKTLKLADIRVLQPPLATFPVFHYLHKKHEALIPKLSAVLQQMQKDKVIERIQKTILGEE